MSTDAGSGTATVTSTNIRPPRSRMSRKKGRLECRIASDTARQAALVESRPWTSTPIPNSCTLGFAVTGHLRVIGSRPFEHAVDPAPAERRAHRAYPPDGAVVIFLEIELERP